nr:4-sulfomuconolactone hydrolase [Quercus suber]
MSIDISLPEGSWDSHVHIVDESDPPYVPRSATVSDLIGFQKKLGIKNVGLVCISVYGNDNRSILDALPKLNDDCRAVACIDPTTISEEELDTMHKAGIRGVRVNLKTREELPTKQQLSAKLHAHATRVSPRNWFLELYLGLDQMQLVADIIPELGLRVVIDHMGSPAPSCSFKVQQGYEKLIELLSNGQVWVKISGTYRFSDLPDLEDYGKALIRAGPKNVIWASDWPHTGGVAVHEDGRTIREYREVNDRDFVRKCFEWCEFDEHLIRNLFVENPARLWLAD